MAEIRILLRMCTIVPSLVDGKALAPPPVRTCTKYLLSGTTVRQLARRNAYLLPALRALVAGVVSRV